MRLLATYRSTGLPAVMFEADGTGSVQYPNGNLRMSFSAETGKGAQYSHTGEVTRTWSSGAEEPIELLLDQHLVCLRLLVRTAGLATVTSGMDQTQPSKELMS